MKAFRYLRWAMFGLLLGWAAASPALAAPFSIRYTGTISTSTHPNAIAGQTYDVTLVFDNGGATALGQTWNPADLRCIIFRFNNARNFVFTNDLLNDPPNFIIGSAATNGAGVLTANFANVSDSDGINPAHYTVSGGTLAPAIDYYANDVNDVFYDTSISRAIADAAGGVQMAPGNWTNPAPFTGNCAGLALGPPPAAVPTMSDFAMWLMSFSLMVAGFFYVRRWAAA